MHAHLTFIEEFMIASLVLAVTTPFSLFKKLSYSLGRWTSWLFYHSKQPCVKDLVCWRKGVEATRSGLLVEETKLACLSGRLHTVLHVQFGKNVTDMAFDRINGNDQCLRNLLI